MLNLINLQMPTTELIGYGLIYFSGILWGVELIPQVIHTAKTKNVEGLSLPFFVICFFAWVCYMLGNGLLNNWNIVIAHIPSLVLFLIMLIMIFRYRGKENGKN